MQAVIKGKKYNTETGERICQTPKGYLYKRYHSIEYFLHDTKSNAITPIRMTEAKELCKTYGTKEQHDFLFVPSTNQSRTNIDLTQESYSKLRICAQLHNKSCVQELHDIIEKAYRNRDRHKII